MTKFYICKVEHSWNTEYKTTMSPCFESLSELDKYAKENNIEFGNIKGTRNSIEIYIKND